MSAYKLKNKQSGFSIVEVLVVSFVMLVVFSALFSSFQYSLKLISDSRAKMTAMTLINDRTEYIRSLPYDNVGTVSGIPGGNIPQNRTITLNGINFSERVLIEYVDDPADGLGASDNNGILSDYKRVKIEYSWNINGNNQTVFSTTNIVPRSIETTAGGGTLRVNVFDANVLPLQNIDVRLVNNTTTSTIDVTRKTDAGGVALFTGAPAASDYEIFVSAVGFSSDQTHGATTSLPNPNTLPVAVLEGDISTMNFQVDRLSDLEIDFYSDKNEITVTESFSDLSGVDTTSTTSLVGGGIELEHNGVDYEPQGFVVLNPLAPTPLEDWLGVQIIHNQPNNTEVLVRFYTSTSSVDLIPDSDLPGNSAGFSDRFIDLSNLDKGIYNSLVTRIFLSTSDTSVTPRVEEFRVGYLESTTPLSSSVVSIRGQKTIGTDSVLAPIYKYAISTTTDGAGRVSLNNIEWDIYTIDAGGDVVVEACGEHSYSLLPNVDDKLSLLFKSASIDNLRVIVKDNFGNFIPNVDVNLIRVGFNETNKTGWCGQTFFTGLVASNDYILTVSALGYNTEVINAIDVSGDTVRAVTLLQN